MKYKALLEGLEITEVKFRHIDLGDRIDAEFFAKKDLEIENTLSALHSVELRNFGTFVASAFYPSATKLYAVGDMPFIRCVDCVNFPLITHFQNSTFEKLPTSFIEEEKGINILHKGDIVITKVGTPSYASLIFEHDKVALSRTVLGIQNITGINPYYLLIFLRSRYGFSQLQRHRELTIQYQLTLERTKRVLVYIAGTDVQNKVAELAKSSIQKLSVSRDLYSEAEACLLECLGMTDFAANPDAYNVKTLKESFLETGRFDAEYYLPKYEDYCRLVQSYANGYEPLGDACDIKDTNYAPEAGVRYKYIELANIGKSGEITGCDIQDGESLPTRARRMVHQGDVIISSIEGSLESCALVTEDYEGALCSTGFYVLQSSKLNSETLLTLFKSLPMQQLMKKGCSGTILTAISKPELEKLPVPIIRQEVQEEIAQHVQKSFALRKEAMQLLENAKITVEQVIENGGGNLLIFNKLQEQAIREERLAAWLLLTEFGMLPTTKKENKTVKTCKKLSDSFLSSGRLDAEYYQPKYDYLFSHLSEFATSTIRELTEIRKSIEPGSDAYEETGVPFIRVSDMSKFGLSDTTIHLNAEDYRDVIRPQKDTILLSKDGSVGIAYKVEEPLDVITSGAILHLSLKSTDVLPDYLTLVLNSPIVRLQAERDAGGSIIQHWKPLEIENVVIPILPMQIQQEIADKIRSSFKLRKESQHLLDEAKRMVEVAIEGIA